MGSLRVSTSRFIIACLTAVFIVGMAAAGWAATPGTSSIIVKMTAGLSPDQVAAVIAADGGVEVSSVPALRLHVVEVPDADLPTVIINYQNDPQVERVEQNQTRKVETIPADPLYSDQWYLPKIGWDSAYGSWQPFGHATVAILDTGVDGSHPDLAGNMVAGTSIIDASGGTTDPNGHGTSLAGIVAAVSNNIGIAGVGFSGVSIMPVTVLGADGTGKDADIIAGILYAVDHGASVILMGFSNAGFSQNLQDAIDYAWSKDVVLVAATGNDAISDPTYPAGDRGVMGVSSTDAADALSTFSNYGKDVFIAAPGEGIMTTSLNSGYSTVSGTSASSAIVAGVSAFLRAYDATLTNGAVVGRIAVSADAAGNSTDETGNGRVNMASALSNTSYNPIEPVGAPGGGPYIGPYAAAATTLATVTGASITQTSANPVQGTSGSATYTVTVTRSSTAAGETSNLSFTPTPTWPTGVTPAWNPANAKVTFAGAASTASATLTISTTTATPAGTTSFTVQAVGASSTKASAITNFTVDTACTAPSITTQPTSQTKTVGDSVTFSVAAGGTAPLHYAWHKVGTTDPVGTDSSSYSISSVAIGDAGTYYVIVSNSCSTGVTSTGATLTVNKKGQTITFNSLPAKTFGDADFAPGATASSGLAVTYASSNTSVATLVSGNIHIVGAGTATITASQAGDTTTYNAATDVTQTLTVTAATPTITWANLAAIDYGTALGATQLNAAATSPVTAASVAGVFTYDPAAGTVLDAGDHTLGVTFAPTDTTNYNGTSATATIHVNKVTPTITWANPAAIDYGTALGATQLNAAATSPVTAASVSGTFTYDPLSGAVLDAGDHTLGVTFAPTDTTNYNGTSKSVTIKVMPRQITVTAVTDSKTYDGTTSSAQTPTITSGSLVPGDTATWTQTFDNKNVGIGNKTLTPAGSVTDSNGGKNYVVTFANVTNGTISPRTVTGSITAANKVYDGTIAATITSRSLSNVITINGVTDDVKLTGGTATFDDQNAGIGKTVTATGLALDGTGMGNYLLSSDTATTKADITPLSITVTADAKTKFFGDPDPPLTYHTSIPLVTGDGFTGTLTRAAGEGVGAHAIQQGSLALNSNYALTYVGANLTIYYNFGGFLDPTSLGWLNNKAFKQGSTIPVKFEILYAGGYCTTATARLFCVRVATGNATGDTTVDVLPAATGDTGSLFRVAGNQYIYNLSTKGMSWNTTYQLQVTLDDGTVHTCLIYLK